MPFLSRNVTVNQHNYRYQVYIPDRPPAGAWPVILALHGGGERGTDGKRQVLVGLGNTLQQYADRYPAIIVFPQVPEGATWQDLGAEIAIAALEQTIAEFTVDLSRIYLTGLSMGAMASGTWPITIPIALPP
ncbi:carboxylesterase family protein [Leptodesmis sp.]|uniref:carboxylesterase family protein n=1 Tax=Leptodesmis sp. TaxID=3100501 RepID=UPI00405351F5